MFGKYRKSNNLFLLFLTTNKWIIAVSAVLMVLSPVLTSWMNYYLQDMINAAMQTPSKLLIIRMLMIGFLVWMLKRFAEYALDLLKAKLLCRTKCDLRNQLFQSMLQRDAARILSNAENEEYVSRFINDFQLLEQRYYVNVIALPGNLIAAIVLCVAFFRLHTVLATVVLIYAVIAFVVPGLFTEYLNTKNNIYLEKIGKLTRELKESFAAFLMIRNYHGEKKIVERFRRVNAETEEARFDGEQALLQVNHTADLMIWFMQFIALGLGLIMVVHGEMLIGTVIASRAFASDIALPVKMVIQNLNAIRSVKSLQQKIVSEIGDMTEPMGNNPETETPAGLIEYRDVVLEINGSVITDHFTFRFEPGKKYMVVGPNGAGKSTLFRLLKKYQNYTAGEILIDNTGLSCLSDGEVSKVVSYIPEKLSFFSDSVKNNICIFEDFPPEILEQAVKAVGLNVELERQLCNNAASLSDGEKRKVEFARSLIRSVPVMVFDEVLSSLDVRAAYEIEEMILSFPQTVVLITHIFSQKHIRDYDEILVIENGRLTAHGNYEQLIRESTYFREICELKFGGAEECCSNAN